MLTDAQVVDKQVAMGEAQKVATQLRYELEMDRADKMIAQAKAQKAKLAQLNPSA